jgi:predicted PurR-regulated permease PerM
VVLVALVAQAAADVLVMVVVSLLLASSVDPLVAAIRGRLGISRVPIILTLYILVIVTTVVLVLLLVPTAVSQATELSGRLPQIVADARTWAEGLEPAILGTTLTRLINTLDFTLVRSGFASPDPDMLVEFGLTAADAALAVMSIATMVFFWLISRETIQRFALAMLPLSERRGVRAAWDDIEGRMGYWVRGQLTLMTVVGVLTTVAYLVLGLPNALLLGVFAGLAEIIPIIGPAIGAVPALITAFVAGGPELALLVAGVYVVIQVVEGQILVPIVMKNAVGLPPFIIIVSLLVGGAVAGLVGALLAVPVATALAAVMENAQARRRSVGLTMIDIDGADDGDGGQRDDSDRREDGSRAAPDRVGA